jgi:hypothetical protein
MDRATTSNFECRVFDNGHSMQYDGTQSGPDKSVFVCACGHTVVEAEDCGSGC